MKRTAPIFWRTWRAPAIGLAIGLTYGAITSVVDLEELKTPQIFFVLDGIMTICLPAILGVLAGIVYNYMQRQARTNRILSTHNAKLQNEILMHLLGSHLLHEIRNPLHNLAAIIEGWQQRVPPEEASLLQRNLLRLEAVANQLRRWNAFGEDMDLRESTALNPWLDDFLTDKVRPQLHDAGIRFEQDCASATVNMHPLLLEQCLATLFNNALEAVMNNGSRVIRLSVQPSPHRQDYVEIDVSNTGTPFPEAVLATQAAQPVSSQHGLGMGLLLVRRTLEQIDGALALRNEAGEAHATMWIPGEPG